MTAKNDPVKVPRALLLECINSAVRAWGVGSSVEVRLWKALAQPGADEQAEQQPVAWDVFVERAAQILGAEQERLSAEDYLMDSDDCIKVLRETVAAPLAQAAPIAQAASDVLAERRRQVEVEGWTPEQDDEHGDETMANAAGCYALHAYDHEYLDDAPAWWPWDRSWWKPGTPRRNLIKAGALILAEIERLDRAALAGKDGVQ